MDESTFKSKMFHAEVMRSTENRPDYWAGYCRGLRRAYHGDRFGTKEDIIRCGHRWRTATTRCAMNGGAGTWTVWQPDNTAGS